MAEPPPTSRYGLGWSAVLIAALLPLVALALFAAPQTDDFCYGAMLLRRGADGVWQHYLLWSGRVVATLLIPLPSMLAQIVGADLFRVYSGFALAFVLALATLAYWLIGRLLPALSNPTRLFFAVALYAVLLANAPNTRQMVFWMPGAFTYTLPAFSTVALFMVLYRSLDDDTWMTPVQFGLFVAALLLSALCNELTGPATVWMLGLSLAARWYRRLRQPFAAQHALLIAAALVGTLVVYLAPGNVARAATQADSTDLTASLVWGTLDTMKFFAIHFVMPGVIGWFMLLALLIEPAAPALTDRRRPVACIAFALLTPLGAAWLAFVAGFYGTAHELPGRAQNLAFFLGVLGLSCALVAYPASSSRARAAAWLRSWLPRRATRARLRLAGVALLVLSPAALAAIWQLPQAPTFRRESRVQFQSLAGDPHPIAYVDQVEATPGLLFANRLSTRPDIWPNTCLAKFFAKRAVIAKPDKTDQ